MGSSGCLKDLREPGIQLGRLPVVHTSLRNVGSVSAGPAAVVDALRTVLGPDGVLVQSGRNN